jgi:hypothetical protein
MARRRTDGRDLVAVVLLDFWLIVNNQFRKIAL